MGAAIMPLVAGLSFGSSVFEGIGAYAQSRNEAENYKANAKMAEADAKNKAAQAKEQYRKLAGAQKAAYGASGVDAGSGSAVDILAGTDADEAMAVMQALYSGRVESTNWKSKAKSAKSAGSADLMGGVLGGAGNLASTGVDQGWWGKK